MERNLMKGNEALAEAAMRAGCQVTFLVTPSHLRRSSPLIWPKRMPKVGGVFLQAESEIAAINMVLRRCKLRRTVHDISVHRRASPLRCEGVSYMAGSDLPCVIVNVHARRPRSRRHSAFPERLLAGYQSAGPRRLPATCICAFHRSGDGRSRVQRPSTRPTSTVCPL